MPTTTGTTISTIRTIAIPASDQDRTLAFFEDLGFTKQFDEELQEGFRWIEVAPPGSAVSVAIVEAGDEMPAGVDTGIRFVARDAAADHAAMTDAGVDVGALLRWPGVPVMFSFRDADGNLFYVSETD
jgi:predicted enzyme related to lactoylglutathione lyase